MVVLKGFVSNIYVRDEPFFGGIGMNLAIVFSYLLGLVILYFVARLLLIPLRVIARLLINGIMGGLLLAIFNLIGAQFGLYLAINPITVLVAGLMGIPGVLLLAAIRYIVIGG